MSMEEFFLQQPEESREALFRAVSTRRTNDRVTPEFFIAHYMDFVTMVIAHGNPSKDTQDTYRKHIDTFLDWCLRKCRVSPFALKEKHIELYRAYLNRNTTVKGTNYSQNSVYNRLVAIRAFYNAAVKQELIETNPCLNVKAQTTPLDDLPFAYYKMSEIKILIDYVKENYEDFECHRALACLYLMAIAGLRCVEVYRANQEDINWNDFTMRVHGKGHDGFVYLDETTALVLQDYLDCIKRQSFVVQQEPDGKTPLIVTNATNKQGTRLARCSIRWNINKILEEAYIKTKGVSCHALRHSCATALYKNTKDLRVVQDVLRHRDPKVTSRYTHVVEELKSRPINMLVKEMEKKIEDGKEQAKQLKTQIKDSQEEQLMQIIDENNISAQEIINLLNEKFPAS